MNHRLVRAGDNGSYVEVTPGASPLVTERDVLDLVSLGREHDTDRLLLHPGVLDDAFFRLSSGLAGAALQKFSNYGLRVALVEPDVARHGERFVELARESNRGRTFGVFSSLDDAEQWLLR
ncbi:DUF4180 domain-containing protein [Deinococcus pimensis]|uniref:DUF4180 domain-containing protein n=1 Tax=Deinococcus pimensis TaxID=309888 RepID=UPI000480E2C8|nr:DUF4180 domain-containing protein [Deinococcus pimensis]